LDRIEAAAVAEELSLGQWVRRACVRTLGHRDLEKPAPDVIQPFVQSSTLDHQKATPRQVEPRFKKGAK
jgi:hypothetical protein